MAQDLELCRRQADPALAALDTSSFEVDDEIAMADHAAAGGVGQIAVRSSKERLDPAHQLAQPERLCQVVVRTQLEADDLVDLVVAGGQDEDRRFRAGCSQAAEDLEAVHSRKSHVQNHEVGRLVRGELEALFAGSGDSHLVTLLLEGVLDPASNRELVFDDQDRGAHGRRLYTGSRARAESLRKQRSPQAVIRLAPFRAPRRARVGESRP